MLIFDGDYPMAYGALELNRDLTLPVDQIRQTEQNPQNIPFASLPEMRRGNVAAALMKFTVRRLRDDSVLPGFRGAEAVYGSAMGQLAYYQALAAVGEGMILTTGAGFSQHITLWEQAKQTDTLPVGFVLGMEGADPILWPEQIHEWWDKGVRVVSLTHYGPSTYAHGTGSSGGLQKQAVDLLQEMSRCGMILDLTHISDESFWEAITHYEGPVLASHQNCRALVPGERQFSDDQLKVIIERGGVIGASMDTWMLYPEPVLDWANTGNFNRRDYFERPEITLEHVVDHIEHVCHLSGNSNHAAIGGDTDGQGGLDGAPHEIDTVADYQKLMPLLDARGFTHDDIANVMYKNWQRFYETNLPSQHIPDQSN